MKGLRKILGLVLTVCIIGGAISGCSNKAATDSSQKGDTKVETDGTELNVFNWSEYLPNSVIKEFEKKYNIKVNYTTYSSNEEMLAKIMAGGSQFDISVASDYMVEAMKKQNLLEELDLKSIPNFKNIGDKFKNMSFDEGNKYTVPYLWGDMVIAVNTKKVKTDVTGYSDLYGSEFKNSLVVLDDERAIIGSALKKLGYSINETDPKKLEEAKKELLKLKGNIKTYDSDSPKTALINGEASAGLVWGAEAVLAQKENKDIKVVLPKEGMYLWQDNLLIPKGAKHKKNAQLFMNFILDPKVSAEITNQYPYANPNTEAYQYTDKESMNNKTIYPDDENMKKGEHLKDLGESLKLYDKIWTEIKQ